MRALFPARGRRPRAVSVVRCVPAVAACIATGIALESATAAAECVLVRERGGPSTTPHFAIHFGASSDLPLRVECATPLDKNMAALSIPIYAYELREGADSFEFALRTPQRPATFEPGPGLHLLDMHVDWSPTEALTSLRLASDAPLCGPVLLGELQLQTGALPDAFRVTMGPNAMTGRCAVLSADGEWRTATLDRGGARVGLGLSCPEDRCLANEAITDLDARTGERAGLVDLSWTRGSGNYTLLRYRTDGQYPMDPWDGQLLAFVPATTDRITHLVTSPGDVRIAAWSITRGSFGNLFAASSIECGALASIQVQLPVATAPRSWAQVKTFYR